MGYATGEDRGGRREAVVGRVGLQTTQPNKRWEMERDCASYTLTLGEEMPN